MWSKSYSFISNTVFIFSFDEQISKTSIDLLATQFKESPDSSVLHVYPVIPMCMVSIHADADTSLRLRYAVPVEGIVEIKTIFIMRSIAIEGMHQSEFSVCSIN